MGSSLPFLHQISKAGVSETQPKNAPGRGELDALSPELPGIHREVAGEIGFLNVGNTGRFDGIDVSEKLVLPPTIMLTKAEQQALKELVALDPKACMQQVPNDEQKLVKDVLDKLN